MLTSALCFKWVVHMILRSMSLIMLHCVLQTWPTIITEIVIKHVDSQFRKLQTECKQNAYFNASFPRALTTYVRRVRQTCAITRSCFISEAIEETTYLLTYIIFYICTIYVHTAHASCDQYDHHIFTQHFTGGQTAAGYLIDSEVDVSRPQRRHLAPIDMSLFHGLEYGLHESALSPRARDYRDHRRSLFSRNEVIFTSSCSMHAADMPVYTSYSGAMSMGCRWAWPPPNLTPVGAEVGFGTPKNEHFT